MAPREGVEVVVAGLGPVGATLAGLLGRRGVRVVAVDSASDVFPLPRAAHIDHTGLRTLQEVGCLDAVMPDMIRNPGIDFVAADDAVLARIPGDQGSPSGVPASMYFHQPGFDRALRETVGALPTVEARLATEVVDVEQTDGGACVHLVGPDGPCELDTAFVVACDGASSPIREELGIPLVDLGFHERWIVVDLVLARAVETLPDRAVTYCDPRRPLGIVPMPGMRYRFELMLLPGEDPEAMQRPSVVENLIGRWVPTGSAAIERIAVYAFHGLVAQPWRLGRVLLAGDAAHQMPPFLGQGMNSGLRDASNLAWKLERVLRGRSGDELLETYEGERKPHVRAVVDAAVGIGRVVCTLDEDEAAERNQAMLAGSPELLRTLSFRLPRLEPGPLVLDGGGQLFVQPVAGDQGRRLDDLLGGRFLVFAADGEALETTADWWSDEAGSLVAIPDELPEYASALGAALDAAGAAVIVVRPDRYVLGAGEGLDAITAAVRPLLTRDDVAVIAAANATESR